MPERQRLPPRTRQGFNVTKDMSISTKFILYDIIIIIINASPTLYLYQRLWFSHYKNYPTCSHTEQLPKLVASIQIHWTILTFSVFFFYSLFLKVNKQNKIIIIKKKNPWENVTHSDNFIQEIKFLTSGRMMDGWMDGWMRHACSSATVPHFFF